MLINSYYLFERLTEATKLANGIRSKTRLDCTKLFLEHGEPYNLLINSKGQICIYPNEPEEVVKADKKRHGIINLTNGKNFSAVYIPDLDFKNYGFGDYGSDGLLFIINNDLTKIEIFICEGLRYYIKNLYQKMIDGGIDKEIDQIRAEAKEFFKYKQL